MRSNKIKHIGCKEMDELITKEISNTLPRRERAAYQRHLKHCPECAHTVQMMAELPGHLQEMTLQPNPHIQQQLRERMRRKSALKKSGLGMPAGFLLDFFRVRVPVYQAALAIGVFIMALAFANNITINNDPPNINMAHQAQIADTTLILDTLSTVIPEKVGRNIKEDSLLARFIMTVM